MREPSLVGSACPKPSLQPATTPAGHVPQKTMPCWSEDVLGSDGALELALGMCKALGANVDFHDESTLNWCVLYTEGETQRRASGRSRPRPHFFAALTNLFKPWPARSLAPRLARPSGGALMPVFFQVRPGGRHSPNHCGERHNAARAHDAAPELSTVAPQKYVPARE